MGLCRGNGTGRVSSLPAGSAQACVSTDAVWALIVVITLLVSDTAGLLIAFWQVLCPATRLWGGVGGSVNDGAATSWVCCPPPFSLCCWRWHWLTFEFSVPLTRHSFTIQCTVPWLSLSGYSTRQCRLHWVLTLFLFHNHCFAICPTPLCQHWPSTLH